MSTKTVAFQGLLPKSIDPFLVIRLAFVAPLQSLAAFVSNLVALKGQDNASPGSADARGGGGAPPWVKIG